jgi:hypothetical protein
MKKNRKIKNQIPQKESKLQEAGEKAVAGATQYGEAVGLKHNTQTAIQTDLEAFVAARNAFEAGKVALAASRAVVLSVTSSAREHLTFSRDALKKRLGKHHSLAWNVTGFVDSLEVPYSPATVQVRLQDMQTYLTANPDAQNEGLEVTAARTEGLLNSLKAARATVDTRVTSVGDLLKARKGAAKELAQRLSWLLEELGRLLDPMDERWKAFGFKKPGAQVTPDVPQGVSATLIGPTAAAVKWTAAPRAEHYRVWKKVVGIDEDFVNVGSPADLDFTLEELPSASSIEVALSAVNDGGESAKSQFITVVTH